MIPWNVNKTTLLGLFDVLASTKMDFGYNFLSTHWNSFSIQPVAKWHCKSQKQRHQLYVETSACLYFTNTHTEFEQ